MQRTAATRTVSGGSFADLNEEDDDEDATQFFVNAA